MVLWALNCALALAALHDVLDGLVPVYVRVQGFTVKLRQVFELRKHALERLCANPGDEVLEFFAVVALGLVEVEDLLKSLRYALGGNLDLDPLAESRVRVVVTASDKDV